MNERIYLSAPDVGAAEEACVVDALRSGWIAPLGPDVDKFEQEMAHRVGRRHAVALSSGTAGLHLALLAKGIGPGDVVLTSTLTFAATANAIVYTGAEPFFIDCEPWTGNMDPSLLEAALKTLQASGEKVRAIVPVDLLGKSADYAAIEAVGRDFGVPVIADAAESLGASYGGKPAGAWGDVAVFSFNGNKIMTTSGGGMLLTDDERVATKVRYLATQARQPVVHYEHTEVGYNYRLSNLLAALGRAQLGRLDDMIAKRRNHRAAYKRLFSGLHGVSIFGAEGDHADNCWLTSILINSDEAGFSAHDLGGALAAQNIESRPLWKPMHMQPVFAEARRMINGSSERLFETGLTLPSGSAMDDKAFSRVESAILSFLRIDQSLQSV